MLEQYAGTTGTPVIKANDWGRDKGKEDMAALDKQRKEQALTGLTGEAHTRAMQERALAAMTPPTNPISTADQIVKGFAGKNMGQDTRRALNATTNMQEARDGAQQQKYGQLAQLGY